MGTITTERQQELEATLAWLEDLHRQMDQDYMSLGERERIALANIYIAILHTRDALSLLTGACLKCKGAGRVINAADGEWMVCEACQGVSR